jgi:uncharacterized RDD family membrane protein YckC
MASVAVTADEGVRTAPPGPAYADAPNRLVAYVLDAIVLTILVFAVSVVVSVAFGPVIEFDSDGSTPIDVNRGLAVVDAIAATLISLVYFVGAWRWLRGTPGQRVLDLRLSDDQGAALSIRRGILRWLFIGVPAGIAAVLIAVLPGFGDLIVDLAVLVWYALLLASIARSSTKQGWHDRVAASVVVKPVRLVEDAR